jgi:hypothetical protein
MAALPLVTPALAKQVWQTMQGPSSRRVARKLSQAGGTISHATVAAGGTKDGVSWNASRSTPLEAARAALDDAVPLLTGDPTSGVV